MKTLIAKELRENFKWLVVGLAIMLTLAFMAQPMYLSNASNKLSEYLGFASGLFAVLLGVVQTVWDFSERQQGFLLHRASSKKTIIVSKIISGAIIYAVVVSVPLLVSALYLAMIGPTYLPVRPLQIVGAVFLVAMCYFLHPVTLFAMIRPAKWYGTKALPLVLPALVCFICYAGFSNTWSYWSVAAVAILALSIFALSIGFRSKVAKFFVVLNSATAVVVAVAVLMACVDSATKFFKPNNLPRATTAQGIDDDGVIWEYKYEQLYFEQGGSKTDYISGGPMSPDKESNLDGPLPENFSPHPLTHLASLNAYATPAGTISPVGYMYANRSMFWDQRGYVLVYDPTMSPPLIGTITRDGFVLGKNPQGTLFNTNPFNAMRSAGVVSGYANRLGTLSFIADNNGVYLLNNMSGELRIVIDSPIKDAFPLAGEIQVPIEFIVDTGKVWERYEVQGVPTEPTNQILPLNMHDVVVTKTASYPPLPESDGPRILGSSPSGKLAALVNEGGVYKIASLSSPNQTEWLVQNVRQPHSPMADNPNNPTSFIAGMTPLGPLIVLFGVASWLQISRDGVSVFLSAFSESDVQQFLLEMFLGLVVVTAITGLLLYVVLRQRFTDKRAFLYWYALMPILGMATPLAVVAIYPKLTFETCPKCDRKRRVDRKKCENCGSGWESLPVQGIEIIEGNALANVASIQ